MPPDGGRGSSVSQLRDVRWDEGGGALGVTTSLLRAALQETRGGGGRQTEGRVLLLLPRVPQRVGRGWIINVRRGGTVDSIVRLTGPFTVVINMEMLENEAVYFHCRRCELGYFFGAETDPANPIHNLSLSNYTKLSTNYKLSYGMRLKINGHIIKKHSLSLLRTRMRQRLELMQMK